MLTFGLVGEGPTDQAVIENVLLGYSEKEDGGVFVNHLQPPRPLTETPGGWGHVFKWLERGRYEEALQYNDYLVIQIDTDRQEDPGYDVPRREGDRELSVAERVERVIARLKREIEPDFYQANEHRILFAIAVDSIECWLLPLLYGDNRAKKTTGCLDSANHALAKDDRKPLSAGKETIRAYDEASSDYRKRKRLIQLRDKNPSLELFIRQLDALQERLTAGRQAASDARGSGAGGREMPGNQAIDPPG